ncbi:hypothetical protein AB1N83_012534 [Pleurotus pulmonarius]
MVEVDLHIVLPAKQSTRLFESEAIIGDGGAVGAHTNYQTSSGTRLHMSSDVVIDDVRYTEEGEVRVTREVASDQRGGGDIRRPTIEHGVNDTNFKRKNKGACEAPPASVRPPRS